MNLGRGFNLLPAKMNHSRNTVRARALAPEFIPTDMAKRWNIGWLFS